MAQRRKGLEGQRTLRLPASALSRISSCLPNLSTSWLSSRSVSTPVQQQQQQQQQEEEESTARRSGVQQGAFTERPGALEHCCCRTLPGSCAGAERARPPATPTQPPPLPLPAIAHLR